MKTILFFATLAAQSFAAQFTASYLFGDGASVQAQFSGALNENVITDISDMSLYVQGTFLPDDYVYLTRNQSFTHGGWGIQDGGATMTLDGSFMNFCFSTENGEDDSYWMAYSGVGFTCLYFSDAGGNYAYDVSSWSVAMDNAPISSARYFESQSVPDNSSTLLLLSPFLLFLFSRSLTPASDLKELKNLN